MLRSFIWANLKKIINLILSYILGIFLIGVIYINSKFKNGQEHPLNNDWIKVGEIGIDAGIYWIGDPCYILHKEKEDKPKNIGTDWRDFCSLLDRENGDKLATQFNYNSGHPGLGVCLNNTGWGDGTYDVEIIKGAEGRIAAVRIIFMPEEFDNTLFD